MEQAGAVHDRELVARAGEGLDPGAPRGGVVEHVLEAATLDQLAHHVAAAAGQGAEAEDAGEAEAFETGEGDGLAHERAHFALAGARDEELEGDDARGHAIAYRPDLSAAARAEAAHGFVSGGEIHRDSESTRVGV